MNNPSLPRDSDRLALPAAEGPVFELSATLLEEGCRAARHSRRGRIIFPIHRSQEAPVQRMLNFLQPGTWVAPHRHPLPGAIETVQMLQGTLGFLLFDPVGGVSSTHRLSAGRAASLIDIEPGVWHGMVVLEPDTVLLEIKRGPYDARTDKEFASWAPAEGSPDTKDWTARWESLFG